MRPRLGRRAWTRPSCSLPVATPMPMTNEAPRRALSAVGDDSADLGPGRDRRVRRSPPVGELRDLRGGHQPIGAERLGGQTESTDHRGLRKAFGVHPAGVGYNLLVLFVGLGLALHFEREATEAITRSTSEACPTVARLLNPSWCSAGLRAPPEVGSQWRGSAGPVRAA